MGDSESRKKDHIDLAFKSQLAEDRLDHRFYYEPMLQGHPEENTFSARFLSYVLRNPIWISSMTGGTVKAKIINERLARAAKTFGMGMGLGSCRMLLDDRHYFEDFHVRQYCGHDVPLFANLGIAQVQEDLRNHGSARIDRLVHDLQADGLIVHVNPLQEWFQPGGDRWETAPIDTIKALLDKVDYPIIVKEVGQGMGPASLKSLIKLPLAAIDFAAAGGTNFALLEHLRNSAPEIQMMEDLTACGHSAGEMVTFINGIISQHEVTKSDLPFIIISGGISNFLDGYYHCQSINTPAIYGQASALLKRALVSQEELDDYIYHQQRGYELASKLLTVRHGG